MLCTMCPHKALGNRGYPHLTDEGRGTLSIAQSAPAKGPSLLAWQTAGAQQRLAECRVLPATPLAPWWGGALDRQDSGLFSLHPDLFCNRTFDDYACWPDGPPGSFVNVSCPWYLPWANSGESPPQVWTVLRCPGGRGCSWDGVRTASFPLGHSLPHPRRSLGLLLGTLPAFPWGEGTVGGIGCNWA